MDTWLTNIAKKAEQWVGDGAAAGQSAAKSAEIAWYDNEITQLKAKWGKDTYDKFVAGDLAGVQVITEVTKNSIAAIEAKKAAAVQAKAEAAARASYQAGVPQRVAVTIPAGAAPGSMFIAATPGGQQFQVAVPAGAAPGTQIVVDVPPAARASSSGAPPPPPPPPPPVAAEFSQPVKGERL